MNSLDNFDTREPLDYLNTPAINDILNDVSFSTHTEATLPLVDGRNLLQQRYPKFNLDGLDSDTVLEMTGRALVLKRLSDQVIELSRNNKPKDAHSLARKIKLIGDPEISEVQTSIKNVLETTHGNLEMASSFLKLDKKEGKGWINFIVRTWGQKPSDFK